MKPVDWDLRFGVCMELGLLSSLLLKRATFHSTLTDPLLVSLSRLDNVRLITPPPFSIDRFGEWQKIWRDVRRCDMLFWVQQRGFRPDGELHLAAFLKLSLRRSAYFIDPFKYQVDKMGYFAVSHRLDPCFTGWAEPADDLKRRFPRGRFEWLPFAAHTDVFYPRGDRKSTFVFWMGRRDEQLHKALLAYCEPRGLEYVYSNDGRFTVEQLGQIASRAQYFVATPPDPSRSGGYSPLVARYFEGLAAGTRLLGVLPKSGEFHRLLPIEAALQVAPDGSDLERKLDEDRENPDVQHIVDLACAFVHKYHSWPYRAQQLFDRLAHGTPLEFPSPKEALREIERELRPARATRGEAGLQAVREPPSPQPFHSTVEYRAAQRSS